MRTPEQNRLAHVAYDTAYSVVPRHAHGDIDRFKSEFDRAPDLGAIHYFTCAAMMRQVEPNAEDVRQLRGHTGRFGTGWEYVIIEYPQIAAVDLTDHIAGEQPPWVRSYVLAPYFSGIVEKSESREVLCFVLGQSPDARTTLRMVSPTMNTNLGPGCEPELRSFLELLRQRTARPVKVR